MSWTICFDESDPPAAALFIAMLRTADFSTYGSAILSGRKHRLPINASAADVLALAALVRHRPGAVRSSAQ